MCDAILNKKLKEKFDESVSAVLPITVIVLLLSIFVVPMETGTIALEGKAEELLNNDSVKKAYLGE